jgi:uncharacterized lipoprotein YajG
MKKMTGIAMASLLALTGCAKQQPVHSLITPPTAEEQSATQSEPEQPSSPFVASAPAQQESASFNDDRASNIQQCRKELDAMRLYSQASYESYQAEFQKIGTQTNKYLQIKDSIGTDINDLVMPRYQFQIRELCFRIKTRLSQLIIRQAG